jgi:Ni/Co efflux regulator RcnB
MIRSVIALIATSALAAKLVQHLSRQQRLKRLHHERQHHDDVSRWEAEGGNLPDAEPVLPGQIRRRR